MGAGASCRNRVERQLAEQPAPGLATPPLRRAQTDVGRPQSLDDAAWRHALARGPVLLEALLAAKPRAGTRQRFFTSDDSCGSPISARDSRGWTLLHMAADAGAADCVALLLAKVGVQLSRSEAGPCPALRGPRCK